MCVSRVFQGRESDLLISLIGGELDGGIGGDPNDIGAVSLEKPEDPLLLVYRHQRSPHSIVCLRLWPLNLFIEYTGMYSSDSGKNGMRLMVKKEKRKKKEPRRERKKRGFQGGFRGAGGV